MNQAPENNTAQPRSRKQRVHVQHDQHDEIIWHQLDDEPVILPVDDYVLKNVKDSMLINKAQAPLNKMYRMAQDRLRERFADRVRAVKPAGMHDGELILMVKPTDGMFDVRLGLDLGRLADELEEALYEMMDDIGGDIPRLLIGFRQETGDAEEIAD